MAERVWDNEYFRKRLAVEKPGWAHVGGDVTSNKSRVKVKCPEGHVIETRACNVFLWKCKECVAEQRRAEMEAEFFAALRAERYTPLERYKNAYTPIRVLCPKGSEWRVSRAHFMYKTSPLRCPCAKCKPKVKQSRKYRTPEAAAREALVKCKFRFNPKDYVNTRTPVPGEWVECGHKDVVLPNNLFRGTARCRTCAGRKKKTTAEYQAEVDKISPGTLVLEEYKGADVKILHRCPCGCEWRTTPSNFLSGYGCPECARRKKSEMWRGENNHWYKHDLTDEEREERTRMRATAEYCEWRRQVYAADKWKCAICGKGGDIHAHHLYSAAKYPGLIIDPENGVTLCVQHHDNKYEGSFHRIYGTHDNNPHQFLEYLDEHIAVNSDIDKRRIARLRERVLRLIKRVEGDDKSKSYTKEEKELAAV